MHRLARASLLNAFCCGWVLMAAVQAAIGGDLIWFLILAALGFINGLFAYDSMVKFHRL
jgi:hypothetical protein